MDCGKRSRNYLIGCASHAHTLEWVIQMQPYFMYLLVFYIRTIRVNKKVYTLSKLYSNQTRCFTT